MTISTFWWRRPAILGLIGLALGALTLIDDPSTGMACGIDWQRPVSHFDGVDEQGHTSYSEKIGELDLGDELKLPLFIIFNSNWEASSPYLGEGWNLCLLESRMEQVDENTFKLVQPDGWYRMFGRPQAKDTLLGGQGSWKAEIKGDMITAYADCGWKLTFQRGKIVSMTTPKGRKLDWVYEGGRVSELREGNFTRLKMEYGGVDGKAQAITLADGQRILLTQGKRPRVQLVGGQNVITGADSSLSGLTLVDGRKQSFAFGATEDKTLPTLKVEDQDENQGRLLNWDLQSKLALCDGNWTYQITPPRTLGENAAIGRTNALGKKEYWFYDGAQGRESIRGSDGIERVRSWYVSGALMGKIRRIEEITGQTKRSIYQASYDEKGRIIRQTRELQDRTVITTSLDSSVLLQETGSYHVTITRDQSLLASYKLGQAGLLIIEPTNVPNQSK